MQIDDPYGELGLTAEASDADVKSAWRRLSARWHPDRNPSPHALHRIQRINCAVEAIRTARDQAPDGRHEPTPQPAAPTTPKRPPPDAQEGPIEHAISLSLEEAAAGCIRTVQGQIARACTVCWGGRQAPDPMPCAQCQGQGQVRPASWFPWLTAPVRCDACGGRGSIPTPCPGCEGSGQAAPLTYRSRLRFPPGVRDGYELHARVKLQGSAAHQSVDVQISVQPHEFMVLDDDGTIRLEVPVDGFAWAAGSWIEVPTLDGLRPMRLQRDALTYRIRQAGFPIEPSGPRADCLVSVVPLFPEECNERQNALLDKLIKTNTGDPKTAAGARAEAWHRTVAAWRGREADTGEG